MTSAESTTFFSRTWSLYDLIMKTNLLITRTFLLALVGAVGVSAPLSAGAEKSIEEITSQVVNNIHVQQGAPVLQVLIARSRNAERLWRLVPHQSRK